MENVPTETPPVTVLYLILGGVACVLWLSAFYKVLDWLLYQPHDWIMPTVNDAVTLALSMGWCFGWLFGVPFAVIYEFWVRTCH
jgi:hypothetical protein